MKVLRKVLALPPTGLSWKAYNAEQEAAQLSEQLSEQQASRSAADEVEVYLDGDHPRIMMAGTTYVLEGADLDSRRANAIKQVTERARNLGQPVRVTAHEPIGSAAVTFHPDGTVEEHPEVVEAEQVTTTEPAPTSNRARALREERPAFEVVNEKGPSIAAKTLRYLLLFLVVIFCITGIRAMIWPYGIGHSAPPGAASSTPTFPAAEASQVAARFTTAYLSWDERDPNARATALGLDLAEGLDTDGGWSGDGVQTVAAVYPGEVKSDDQHHGHVVVLARVIPFKIAGKQWVPMPAVWRRVSVPVEVGPNRVVVSGTPAYLPDTTGLGAGTSKSPAEADDSLTSATQSDARAFFTAYASSDEATSAITAPGSSIRSLSKTVELESLKSWTVDAGEGDRRTAHASVVWKLAGATTQLTQDYTLTLIRSTAADGMQRWQVAEITNN